MRLLSRARRGVTGSARVSDFDAHKAFEEAKERHEQGERHGASWVPIAAAILAVITAIFGGIASQNSSRAFISKNEAILETAHASDTYAEYESRSIKEHIYEAQVDAGNARDPAKELAVATHEKTEAKPLLGKARRFEAAAATANEVSERSLRRYETMEVGITFLDIAIVLVSISALVTTRALTIVAAAGALGGIVVCLYGAFK
jgi:hypothetical protein